MNTIKEILNYCNIEECINYTTDIAIEYARITIQRMKIESSCPCSEDHYMFMLTVLLKAFKDDSNFDEIVQEFDSVKGWIKNLNDLIYDYSMSIIVISAEELSVPQNGRFHLNFLKELSDVFESNLK